MGYRIHVVVEQKVEIYPMASSRSKKRREQYAKHKYHHGHDREPTTYPKITPTPNSSLDLTNEPEIKEKLKTIQESREESSSDSNRFFHQSSLKTAGINQTTNVTVNVQPKGEDCMSGCFSGIAKCFGKT